MRIFLAGLTAAALVCGAAQADGFKRITSAEEYNRLVSGKTYCNKSGCWKARKNGTMTGKFGKEKFRANWKYSKGFACRAGRLGKRDIGTDCQVVEINGPQVRITRNQGKGKQVVYTEK